MQSGQEDTPMIDICSSLSLRNGDVIMIFHSSWYWVARSKPTARKLLFSISTLRRTKWTAEWNDALDWVMRSTARPLIIDRCRACCWSEAEPVQRPINVPVTSLVSQVTLFTTGACYRYLGVRCRKQSRLRRGEITPSDKNLSLLCRIVNESFRNVKIVVSFKNVKYRWMNGYRF